MLAFAIRNESERTYAESSAAGTDDDGVVGVIDDGVVTNTTLALFTDTSVKICCVPSHKWLKSLHPFLAPLAYSDFKVVWWTAEWLYVYGSCHLPHSLRPSDECCQ